MATFALLWEWECETHNEVTEMVPVGEIMGSFHVIRAGTDQPAIHLSDAY